MRHSRKRHIILTLTLSFALLIFNSTDCSAQLKPWTLRGCMRYLNKNIDDTTKYDFKVSPYNYCYFKHGFGSGFRNGMGLWRFNPLTLHFRFRGVKHPDDMSSIIKRSFHRYLNDEPIKFREQKKKYKTYWEETSTGRDYNEIHYELWGQYETPDSIKRIEYLELFYIGRHVRGYFVVAKQTSETSFRDEYVDFVAEVIKIDEDKPTLKIISVDKIPDGFSISDMTFNKAPEIGDIKTVDDCSVYLIPDK